LTEAVEGGLGKKEGGTSGIKGGRNVVLTNKRKSLKGKKSVEGKVHFAERELNQKN